MADWRRVCFHHWEMRETPLWPYVVSLAGLAGFAAMTAWLGYACTAGTLPVCPELVCPLYSATDVVITTERWTIRP